MTGVLDSIWAGFVGASALQQAATVLGLLSVALAIRQSLWTFPIGLVQVTLTGLVFFHQRLYADMSLQAVYVVALAYGWWRWLRPGGGRLRLPVTRLKTPVLAVTVACGLAATFIGGDLLASYGDDPMPFRDAFIASFGVLSQVLEAGKKIEAWAGWLAINLAGVAVYALIGLDWFVALYLIYAVMSVIGFQAWHASMRNDVATT